MVARKYVSLNIEYPPLPRAFLKILKMANMSPTEPAMHLTKVTMTTILSQRKAGPWKRDIEKTKGTDSLELSTLSRFYIRVKIMLLVLGTRECLFSPVNTLQDL